MANKKISELTERTTPTGNEYIPVADSGENYKIKVSAVKPDPNVYLTKTDAQNTYQPKGNYLTSVPSQYVTETELEEKGYETSTHASQTYATKTSLQETNQTLTQQGQQIEALRSEQEALKPYGLARWEDGELDPDAIERKGSDDFLASWYPYLIDTTDNAGRTTRPVGKLRRNNWLRFEDGTFAPTVGITATQKAQCDVELYLDASHTQKYCDAGAFDPAAFYNQYGMTQKLYDSTGAEITHILRPWETVETKYTIGVGRDEDIYVVDQMEDSLGKTWRGISARPKPVDGIDASPYKLSRTAISPGPVCTVGGKTRAFFYLYEGEGNCKSANGQGNLCTLFSNGRTYPRTTDCQQVNNMNWARANNADTELSYPFAEGGYHAMNAFITAAEARFGTKYLHKDTLFGSGISSNDSCDNESSWKLHGGVRYKKTADSAWTYAKWATQGNIYYNATGGRTNFTTLINQEYPKEQCLESHMAASFAVETGVAEGEEFTFYGATYWYQTPTGVSGLQDGEMNVRLYKRMAQTFTAYDSAGEETSWDVEVILRMSLVMGMSLIGDIFAYWGGGYEQVGTCQGNPTPSTGNPVKLYLQPDQTKWLRETAISKNDLGVFPFESSYSLVGQATNLGDGYVATRQPFTPWKLTAGGSVSTGECAYGWSNCYWSSTLNQRIRIAVRLRGYASHSGCAARHLHALHAASTAYRTHGGSAQCLLG